MSTTLVSLALIALSGLAATRPAPLAQDGTAQDGAAPVVHKNTAVEPADRNGEDWWRERMKACNARIKKGNVDLIFLGDSITQGWEGPGKEVWETFYGKRKAINLGFSGDRTQHVLWRLERHGLENLALAAHPPSLVVLMIGTNNSNGADNTAEEIGQGIEAIVSSLRAKMPQTKILVLGIFPRGAQPDAQREKNAEASAMAAKLADDKNVFYLDIGKRFLAEDGSLNPEIMPDYLHPNAKGYEIWAEAIEPTLKKLLGES